MREGITSALHEALLWSYSDCAISQCEEGMAMLRNALEPWHLVLVILVFAVLFGHKRLPDAARGIGRSLRILKAETRALNDRDQEPESDPSGRPRQR